MTKRAYESSITLISFLFLLLIGTATASAQSASPPAQDTQPSVESSRTEGVQESTPPIQSPARSRATGWFNRSGSGVFIALTPFATAVTLIVLLLLIVLPLLLRAAFKRKTRGYFKTVSYARQRRYA